MLPRASHNYVRAVFAAFAVMLISVLGTDPAEARKTPQNTILIQIDQGGDSPTSKDLSMGLNKAAVISLPVNASDVIVPNPKIIDAVIRSPRKAFLVAKEVGQTNAFFLDAKGQQILNLEITVERDLEPLKEIYKRFFPESRIIPESVNDNIILTGTVDTPSASTRARDIALRFTGAEAGDPSKVINMLAIRGDDQVMLQVRIAEMQRSLAKQLGIDLDSAFEVGEVDFNIALRNPFSLLGQFLTEEDSTTQIGTVPGQNISSTLRAFERNGLVKILAEPSLTAISGEAASFLAGGEFPVPSARDRDGNVTIEFKPFGVGLGFTPVVLGDGRISLRMSTEVSELTADGAFLSRGGTAEVDGETVIIPGVTIPALAVRRAETTVELPSGGSLVIAGLLQEINKQNIDGMPGLKSLPILGQLFRSRDFINDETELVIMVTPYLVKPVNKDKIALPTDGFIPASDLETLLFGRLNGVNDGVPSAPKPKQGPKQPVGFIVD